MKDSGQTKEHLIREVQELRQRIKELEKSGAGKECPEEEEGKQEDPYREFFMNAETHRFLLLDSSFDIIDANNVLRETWTKLLGIGNEEIVGRNFMDIIPYFREHDRLVKYKEVIKTGRPFYTEEVTPPLQYGDLHLSVSVFKVGNGLGVVTTDITQQKHTEKALRETQETIESSISAIALSDPEGRLTYVNPSFLRLWGYSDVREVLEKSVLEFWEKKKEASAVIRALHDRGGWTGDLVARRKDGSLFHVRLTASITANAEGAPVSMMASFIDVTQQKRMEEEFTNIQKMESLGVLAGGIAHDFNNLLTPILANISMAKAYGKLDSEVAEMLTDAEKASLRAIGLTQQLLTFAKGGVPIRKAVSVHRLLEETAGFALSGSNVRCGYDLPDDLWFLDVDEGQIGQVIQNLVINADQAMPDGGTLRIKAENITVKEGEHLSLKKGRYVQIALEDEGVGIPEKQLFRVFDPFFSTKEKGRGLGLSTSLSIVTKHGGAIELDTRLGEGSTFRIYLPASETGPMVQEKEERALFTGKGKILLIDDEEMVRRSGSKFLKRLGYEVEISKGGSEGIGIYRQAMENEQPFDAVLVDLTIPGGMGGKEVVKRLKEIDPQANVVVSSGYSDDPVMSDFEAYGFSGVLKKPYRIQDMDELLRKTLREKG